MTNNSNYRKPESYHFSVQLPRKVSLSHGWYWINESFRYFNQSKNVWMLSMFFIFIVLTAPKFLAPVFQLVIFFIAPFIAAGLSTACADLENNKKMTLEHIVSGFNNENRVNIFRYGILLLLMFILAIFVMSLLLTTIGVSQEQLLTELESLKMNPNASIDDILNSEVMLKYTIVTIIVLLPVIAINIFAPLILTFTSNTAIRAVQMSFSAVFRNIAAILLYGIILIILLSIIIFVSNFVGEFMASVFGNQSIITMVIYMFVLYTSLFMLGSVSYSSAYVAFKDIFTGERL